MIRLFCMKHRLRVVRSGFAQSPRGVRTASHLKRRVCERGAVRCKLDQFAASSASRQRA